MLLFETRSPGWLVPLFALALPLAAQDLPTVPILHSAPMAERFGKPYVMVSINGHGPYRFIIDTGTGADAFISPELADQLHLPTVAEVVVRDPSGQGGQRVGLVTLDTVELAGIAFHDIRAIRHTITGEAGTCQGLLGFTLFRNYLLTLDFPRRQVILAQGALQEDGARSVLPFHMPDGVPVTSLRVNGRQVDAQLDSGGGGLTLPEELAAHMRWEIAPVVFASGQTMATRFEMKAAKLGSDVTVGRYTFTHPVVEIHPAFPLVNFGSPPMQSFA
ncbi:MAG: retropepsin-like aspartic protease, partial [Terracidiphilus sp.]